MNYRLKQWVAITLRALRSLKKLGKGNIKIIPDIFIGGGNGAADGSPSVVDGFAAFGKMLQEKTRLKSKTKFHCSCKAAQRTGRFCWYYMIRVFFRLPKAFAFYKVCIGRVH